MCGLQNIINIMNVLKNNKDHRAENLKQGSFSKKKGPFCPKKKKILSQFAQFVLLCLKINQNT